MYWDAVPDVRDAEYVSLTVSPSLIWYETSKFAAVLFPLFWMVIIIDSESDKFPDSGSSIDRTAKSSFESAG